MGLNEESPGGDLESVVVSEADLQARVRALGRQIVADYAGRDLHLISILRGGLIFLADLARAIDRPLTMDTLAVSSYVGQTQGNVRITKDLDDPIAGRHVLVIEDIIDTGLTLTYVRRVLLARQPASLSICALLDKPHRRIIDLSIDYTGFTIPDLFVVGYGLDWRGQYRNLPCVGVLKPELYR